MSIVGSLFKSTLQELTCDRGTWLKVQGARATEQRGRVRNAIGCGLVELTTANECGLFDANSVPHMVADTHHVPLGPTRETFPGPIISRSSNYTLQQKGSSIHRPNLVCPRRRSRRPTTWIASSAPVGVHVG
ncbi:hypothetical protein GW17_00041074 [Ensete ventricosum]|nr:hypothetical protein GW17_00041074 [Ensete ventricosum]